jgi:hypothetical protein
MKILKSLRDGIAGSVKSWKWIIIIWLCSLILASLVTVPMKGALKVGLGKSMITEKLADGINVEVFADLGTILRIMISYFSKGLLMVFLIGFLTNAFLFGGLFDSLKASSGKYSVQHFFMASAKYFWSFFIISLIISLIVILLVFIIIVIPVSLVNQAEISPEGATFKTVIIATSVFLLLMIVLLLVADYARAWQVKQDKNACFKALGFGFRKTFRTFFSSYSLMLILVIGQLLYVWLVFKILPGIKPSSGGGVLLLFILAQSLFFIKILLKTCRFGSVTKLMEVETSLSVS